MFIYFALEGFLLGGFLFGENDEIIWLMFFLIVKLGLSGEESPSLWLKFLIDELDSPYKRLKSRLFLEYFLTGLNEPFLIGLLEPSSYLNLSMRFYRVHSSLSNSLIGVFEYLLSTSLIFPKVNDFISNFLLLFFIVVLYVYFFSLISKF